MKKIAILGPKNTYSEVAANHYQSLNNTLYELVYQKRVSDVFQAVSDETIGIIPIENTLEGYVQQHLDYMLEYPHVWIASELRLQVSFAFIAQCPLEEIQTVYVQYATKNQCLKFMSTIEDKEVVITDSNSQSYERYLRDPKSGVILPKHIYKIGMAPFEIKDVTDEQQNETRFFVIHPHQTPINHQENVKMAIVFTPTIDRPGLLLSIVEAFAKAEINLISIMSRPTKKVIGTYHFFIELECKAPQIIHVESILKDLSQHMHIRLLGIFDDHSL